MVESEDLKRLGRDASIAPSTLEKGVEPVQVPRKRNPRKRPILTRTTRVHPVVWEEVKKLGKDRYVYVVSDTEVFIINKPPEEIDWLL